MVGNHDETPNFSRNLSLNPETNRLLTPVLRNGKSVNLADQD